MGPIFITKILIDQSKAKLYRVSQKEVYAFAKLWNKKHGVNIQN